MIDLIIFAKHFVCDVKKKKKKSLGIKWCVQILIKFVYLFDFSVDWKDLKC